MYRTFDEYDAERRRDLQLKRRALRFHRRAARLGQLYGVLTVVFLVMFIVY